MFLGIKKNSAFMGNGGFLSMDCTSLSVVHHFCTSSSSLLRHHHDFSEKSSSLCDCVEYAQEWILSEQLASSYSPQYMRKTFKGNDDNDDGGDDYDGDGDDGLQVLTLRDI